MPADRLIILEIKDRRSWRAWLQKNAATSAGVWLVDLTETRRTRLEKVMAFAARGERIKWM